MRSLLVISATPPRETERFIATQAMALRRAGWTLTLGHGGETAHNAEAGEIRRVVAPLTSRPIPRTPLERARRLVETIVNRNCEPAAEKDLAQWRNIIAAEKPNLILLQFGPTAARLLPLLRQIEVPWVVQFHGFDVTERARHWGYRLTLRNVVHSASAVFGCSAFLTREIRRLTGHRNHGRVMTVSPGYDEDIFVVADRTTFADTRRPARLVSVGRLTEVKGHHLVLQAVARCRSEVGLTIVGDGEWKGRLSDQVQSLGLQAAVRFAGEQSRNEVAASLAAADIFVQASTTASNGAREGLGLSPIEAAATGLPIIVTNSGGLSETCIDGQTGLIVGEGDVNALAEAIDRLAENPSERRSMGMRGARFVAATYSSTVQACRASEVFSRLISARGDPSPATPCL